MTIVYRYGLLPPIEGAALVDEQISLAHKYYNKRIELERQRRAELTAATADDVTRDLEASIAAEESALAVARKRISSDRSDARSPDAGDARPAKAIVARLKELRQQLRDRRKARREDPEVVAASKLVNDAHGERARAARSECGVYWGTYLAIEEATDQAAKANGEPKFRRLTGDGLIGVQCQNGLPASELLDAADTRLRITKEPEPVPGRGGKPLRRLMIRIGSVVREPVWAVFPIIYHRPIPDGAQIKRATVVRRFVASKPQWAVCFTLDIEAPRIAPTVDATSAVAVDLGWRKITIADDPTTRAAGWYDGTTTHDLPVDPSVLGELRKCDDIRSIRDRHQNAMHARIPSMLTALPLTEEHKQRLAHLAQWKSPARFSSLAIWWRTHRLPGDESLLTELETWRLRDKHLWLWEANARQKALRRRREQYRVLASKLSDRFATLIIEKLDLAALKEIPSPESDRESNPVSRSQLHATAPHELRSALISAFRMRAREVVEVPPQPSVELVWKQWREGLGEAKARPPARSERFKRIRGIKSEETAA